MKKIYIEKWESLRSCYGRLYEINLEELAEEQMMPELLEMDKEELDDWLSENAWDFDLYDNPLVSVCHESDPDSVEEYLHCDYKVIHDDIDWRGFYRGYADGNMSPEDAKNKDEILNKLKKELELLQLPLIGP